MTYKAFCTILLPSWVFMFLMLLGMIIHCYKQDKKVAECVQQQEFELSLKGCEFAASQMESQLRDMTFKRDNCLQQLDDLNNRAMDTIKNLVENCIPR